MTFEEFKEKYKGEGYLKNLIAAIGGEEIVGELFAIDLQCPILFYSEPVDFFTIWTTTKVIYSSFKEFGNEAALIVTKINRDPYSKEDLEKFEAQKQEDLDHFRSHFNERRILQ